MLVSIEMMMKLSVHVMTSQAKVSFGFRKLEWSVAKIPFR